MTKDYILTSAAEADLREIIRSTRKQWGEAQVRRYLAKLEQGMVRLAAKQEPFREMGTLYPELRMARCEHHFVFCLPREKAPALIVAVFHERMDLMTRLARRLDSPRVLVRFAQNDER